MALRLNPPPRERHLRSLPPSYRPFDNLTNYLSGSMSLAQTTESLTQPIENDYDHDSQELVYLLLEHLWQTFSTIVSQISHHNHSAHSKLASLLVSIKHRSVPSSESSDLTRHIDHEGQLWADLPLYEPQVHGEWISPVDKISALTARAVDLQHDTLNLVGGPEGLREQYTNTNAFLARLVFLRGGGCDYYDLYALLALRWALEDELDAEGLGLNVGGAAVWILYAGERIWRSEKEWVGPEIDRLALCMSRGSAMWDGGKKNGFCVERWEMWREAFQRVADMEDVFQETRELAGMAAEKMRWIARNVDRN